MVIQGLDHHIFSYKVRTRQRHDTEEVEKSHSLAKLVEKQT